jgi:hypothetical protein
MNCGTRGWLIQRRSTPRVIYLINIEVGTELKANGEPDIAVKSPVVESSVKAETLVVD